MTSFESYTQVSVLYQLHQSFRQRHPLGIIFLHNLGIGKMEAVVEQVRGLAGSADEAGRSKVLDQLRELIYSLESPDETMNRIMFLVSLLIMLIHIPASLRSKKYHFNFSFLESPNCNREGQYRPRAF